MTTKTCDHCYRCIGDRPAGSGLTYGMTRMIVCISCGNKRCPHASDHRLACTGSNEPGQAGSRYQRAGPPTEPIDVNEMLASLFDCLPRYRRTSRLGRSARRWLL